MSDLPERCEPCSGDTPPLTAATVEGHLVGVPAWRRDGQRIRRRFRLKGFRAALAWVNRVGMLAEEQGHHPDILIENYREVEFTLSTHAIGGLSLNDFVLAHKIDALAQRDGIG